jgi:hypothetical protein
MDFIAVGVPERDDHGQKRKRPGKRKKTAEEEIRGKTNTENEKKR